LYIRARNLANFFKMTPKLKEQNQGSLFFSLRDTLNPKHPLFVLANQIQWDTFEKAFKGLYCPDNGRPAKPIRLMVGLLMLKHIRNLSDQSVVEQWSDLFSILYRGNFFCAGSSLRAFGVGTL